MCWVRRMLLIAILVVISSPAIAATYYVPDDFTTIQAALDAAVNDDIIIVRNGTYTDTGNIDLDFNGKALTLRSESGPESCIIDTAWNGRGFYFHNNEIETSVLRGFTIKNGSYDYGSGIFCNSSSPLIENCILMNNSADSGGAVYCDHSSSPDLVNCVFKANLARHWGGAVTCDYSSNPSLITCTFIENQAQDGGNNVSCHNASLPSILSCIIWSGQSITGSEIALYGNSELSVDYSDVEGGTDSVYVEEGSTLTWGTGNIVLEPGFVWEGEYHLSSTSPCINTGTDTGVYEDIDGDVRPQGTGFDIGADEYTEDNCIRRIRISENFGVPGDTGVVVPILINGASGFAGANIIVAYDSANLTAIGAQTSELTASFLLISNTTVLGQIAIAMASINIISSGSGTFVEVLFDVSPSAAWGDSTALALVDVSLFDEDAHLLPFCAKDGLFNIGYPKGDINDDYSINSGDAILALRIAVGLQIGDPAHAPTSKELSTGDVNCDSLNNAGDAILILRKAAGLIIDFPCAG